MVQYNGSMPEEITIDGSGRLVIPKDVRARHRLTAGARLLLVEEEDRLVLVPRASETATVERAGILVFRGALAGAIPDHRDLRNERLDHVAGRH
jgi:AbrB family looped-hinge helix DNA binding protein